MPPSISSLTVRWAATAAASPFDHLRSAIGWSMALTALVLMYFSEGGIVANAVFILTWALLNCFWIALLRRPLISVALSLVVIVLVILLSQLKYGIVWMTANFLDVWIINADTFNYLLSVKPDLGRNILIAAAFVVPVLAMLWWFDPVRIRRTSAAIGFAVCLVMLAGISLAFPQEEWDAFSRDDYVSKFVRSGVTAIVELTRNGYMESAEVVTERLKTLPDATCAPTSKPPHIILVHDEFELRYPYRLRGQRAGGIRPSLPLVRR